jgi:superfamily I DNA/RNA helicase
VRLAIVSYLRGDFDLRPSLRAQAGAVKEELLQLTRDQYRILDGLTENPRVIVLGSAGTGKTLLAVEEARRLADASERVLFCCFNNALGAFLRTTVADAALVDVRTIHSFMASLVSEAGFDNRLPAASTADLFTVFYPELALEVLLDQGPRYDALIIDEGQDVLREAYVDVLDAALDGGLDRARWRVFLDPKQNVFDGIDPASYARLLGREPLQYRLSINCRNTAPIATDTAILSGTSCEEVLSVEGPQVDHEWYRDAAHERRLVGRLLSRLLSQGFRPDDVVVLGVRSLSKSSVSGGLEPLTDPLVEAGNSSSSRDTHSIRYSTISAFKGLEADAVVLVDIGELHSAEARRALYVGTSRARVLLSVFINEAARPDFEALAVDFGERLTSEHQLGSDEAEEIDA